MSFDRFNIATADLISMSVAETQVPEVSQAELYAFHAHHFSEAAVELFTSNFLRPQPLNEEEEPLDRYDEYYGEEQDDLGYYPDGVKRTLTDEQIAIFRHSELEELRRKERKEAGTTKASTVEMQEDADESFGIARAPRSPKAEETAEAPASEDGELESDSATNPPKTQKNKKKRRRNKSRQAQDSTHEPKRSETGWFKKTVKPDLRKRTWDVVEAGMDSLDYDEIESASTAGTGPAMQRRKISYDD